MKVEHFAPRWKNMYLLGGVAAILVGLLFRRNLGVKIAHFSLVMAPTAVNDWFTLLETHRLLGWGI